MPVSVSKGATLGVSSTLPASFDATGYNALTFTAIGEIVDAGEIAKVFNVVSHQSIGRDYPQKFKGTYDIGNFSVTVGTIAADAGQVLLQSGLTATTSYSFKITMASGDVAEFTGKILKAGKGALSADGIETTVIDIAVDPESLFEA